jgi:hypothetical protein
MMRRVSCVQVGSVALDEMSTAGWKLVRVRPEISDSRNETVLGEIEEAKTGLATLRSCELDPASCPLTFSDNPFDGDVPVVREAFDVESNLGLATTHLFSRLRPTVQNVLAEQSAEGVPVPGLGCRPIESDHFVRGGHAVHGNSSGTRHRGPTSRLTPGQGGHDQTHADTRRMTDGCGSDPARVVGLTAKSQATKYLALGW